MFVVVVPREPPTWEAGVADKAVGPFESLEAAALYLAESDADPFTGMIRRRVGSIARVLPPGGD